MTYDSNNDELIALTKLADDLGLKPVKKPFNEDNYLDVTLIPVEKLYVDKSIKDCSIKQ